MADASSTPNETDITSTLGLDLNEEVSKLAEIFPQFVKDGAVDFDAFKAWFTENAHLADVDEKYGLGWAGKSDAVQAIRRKSTGTLKPDKEQSKNWDTTQNLFIEGDNLEVLKLLMRQFASKVKMIYIDPPYNTGKDFVYKDNFHEGVSDYYQRTGQDKEGSNYSTNSSSSGRYHSDWLNMMYPRLFYAKQMLTEDGVIFVSIDDNEVYNLRQVLDEVFGEENCIGLIPTIMNLKGNQDAYGFAETHEYFLVYAKSKSDCEFGRLDVDEEGLGQWLEDEHGPYKVADNLRATGVNAPRSKRPNLFYPIYIKPTTNEIYISDDDSRLNDEDITVLPINPEGEELSWYWSKTTARDNFHNLIIKNTKNGYQFYRKQRPWLGDIPTKKPKSVFYRPEYSTSTATIQLKDLLGKKVFDGPKPVPFIYDLLQLGSHKEAIIMDFFSGSGTTAHAVMKLNATDGGSRRWICIQLPEETPETSEAYKAGFKSIPEIAQERIRRAGNKILKDNAVAIKERKTPLDTGFKAFTLANSNYRRWQAVDSEDENAQQLLLEQAEKSISKPLIDKYSEIDVVFEVVLKEGLDLNAVVEETTHNSNKIYSITDGDRKVFVTFADKIDFDFTNGLNLGRDDLLVCLDSSLLDADKANLLQNIKLKTI